MDTLQGDLPEVIFTIKQALNQLEILRKYKDRNFVLDLDKLLNKQRIKLEETVRDLEGASMGIY